jgi:hypothetical protein
MLSATAVLEQFLHREQTPGQTGFLPMHQVKEAVPSISDLFNDIPARYTWSVKIAHSGN